MKMLLLLFFLSLSIPAAAQETCSLKLSDAPALFGLRLGMLPEEARAVFGGDLKIKFKKKGDKVFFQNFIKKPAPASLNDVRALYLRFLDRKLYQVEIFYEDKTDRRTLEDFEAELSATLKLPAALWQNVKGKSVINCGEFTISADKILNPHVELTDEASRAKALELRTPPPAK